VWPLQALSLCRTHLLEAECLAAVRTAQAHAGAQLPPTPQAPPSHATLPLTAGREAKLRRVREQEALLAASGLMSLHDFIAGSLRPAIAAAQQDLTWGLALGSAAVGAPVDTVIMDEAGCSPDYCLPLLLSLRPSNLVRATLMHGPSSPGKTFLKIVQCFC
jgi:hypothetical protein